MAISPWLATQLLRASLTGQQITIPTTLHVALYNGNPFAGGNEVTGGGYARQAVAFDEVPQPSGYPAFKNSALVSFPVATTTWDTITHVCVMTAVTDGNALWAIQIDPPRQTIPGDNPKIDVGDISIEFAE